MKRYIVLLNLVIVLMSHAQQGVSISNNAPAQDPSAILDIKNTTKGILLPRMTASQRNAISQPAKGLLIFQTDGSPGFYYYDGNAWLNLNGDELVNDNGTSQQYGITSVFAGSTYGMANGSGSAAKFKAPVGITFDHQNNLFIADSGNHNIRKITPYGLVSHTAGISLGYFDNIATVASFHRPMGIVADAQDNLFVADFLNNRIRKIDPAGNVTTFAGSDAGFINGTTTAANFSGPTGIAIDNSGNFYVTDYNNNAIRKITPAGVVITLAGNGTPGLNNGTGAAATFSKPSGLAVDPAGNVYVADKDNHCIRKITAAGVVTTFAGTGVAGNNNGPAATSTFHSPKAITQDIDGSFYVADAGNHSIRKISPDGVVTTVAGTGAPGFADGLPPNVMFNDPSGVIADKQGYLYVTDTGNYKIRKIKVR